MITDFLQWRKKPAHNNVYKQWLVPAYLEIPTEFPMASTCLQLSVPNHATAHTLNVSGHPKRQPTKKDKINARIRFK